MGRMWVQAEIHMQGFIEVDWPDGMSQDEVCQEKMEDADLSFWVAQLNRTGIVIFGVTPAQEKEAVAFQKTRAFLAKPHNPADSVERKRPERK